MTPLRALIGFVGQGTGGGVKVRVEPYPGLPQPDRGSQAHARLEQEWALAGDAYTSNRTPQGFTLKLSRHRSADGSDWIWIALYQAARFSEDQRGGLYSGTGILLDGLPDPSGAVAVINTLFQFQRTLFRGDVMVGHLGDLDIPALRLPQLPTISALAEKGGLDPRSRDGCLFPGHDVSAQDTFIRDIKESFFGSQYSRYSAVYFCDDAMDGRPRPFHSDGHVPAAAPPAASSPAAFFAERAEQFSFADKRGSSASVDTPQDEVLRLVRRIEQRVIAVESHLRWLQDSKAEVSPASDGARGGWIARRIAFALTILALVALLLWSAEKVWSRLSPAEPGTLATTAQSGQKDDEPETRGPRLVATDVDANVPDGQPVRVTAEASAQGVSSATTSVILRDGGQVVATGYSPGLRAQTTVILRKPGAHHLVIECEAHRAVIEACRATPAPAGEPGPTPPIG